MICNIRRTLCGYCADICLAVYSLCYLFTNSGDIVHCLVFCDILMKNINSIMLGDQHSRLLQELSIIGYQRSNY